MRDKLKARICKGEAEAHRRISTLVDELSPGAIETLYKECERIDKELNRHSYLTSLERSGEGLIFSIGGAKGFIR